MSHLAALPAFQSDVVFTGTTPLAASYAGGKLVICAAPIANGTICSAWASEVCPVQVDITDDSHGHADVSDGITGRVPWGIKTERKGKEPDGLDSLSVSVPMARQRSGCIPAEP